MKIVFRSLVIFLVILVIGFYCYLGIQKYFAKSYYADAVHMYNQYNFDEATDLAYKALNIQKEFYNDSSSEIANSYFLLDLINSKLRKYQEAKPLLLKARNIYWKTMGYSNILSYMLLEELAWVNAKTDNFARSDALFKDVLDQKFKQFGNKSIQVSETLSQMAKAKVLQGKYQEAKVIQLDALSMIRSVLSSEHVTYLNYTANLARIDYHLQNYSESLAQFELVCSSKNYYDMSIEAKIDIERGYLMSLINQSRLKKAQEVYQSILSKVKLSYGRDSILAKEIKSSFSEVFGNKK